MPVRGAKPRARVAAAGKAEPARRVREVEERYEIVMGAMRESVYDWDLVRDRFWVARSMQAVVGMPPGLNRLKDWQKRIHPDDYPRFRADTIAHLKGQTERFECDYRYRAADGGWRWARTHGIALRDAKGRAVRMVGSTGDITELKQAAEALRRSEERYALATDAAVEGIYEWDIESGSLYLTERAKTFFDMPAQTLTPGAWNVRVHPEDFPRYRAALIEHFKGRSEHLELEYRIADTHGGHRWVLDRGKALRNAAGRAVKMVGALSDITQRKHAELELRRARDEANEALEQQTATAEILRVISRSPTSLGPVFEAILANAMHLCDAHLSLLNLYDGAKFRTVAQVGANPAFEKWVFERGPYTPDAGGGLDRMIAERRPVQVNDVKASQTYRAGLPNSVKFVELAGARTFLAVPLLKEGAVIGAIAVYAPEPRAFTEKQIALVSTFAEQAVIALENVRLFNETKEALEQQKASSEVLAAIGASIADAAPVFEKILESCQRLFQGYLVGLTMVGDDGQVRLRAYQGPKKAEMERIYPLPLTRDSGTGCAILDRAVIHYPDIEADGVPDGVRSGARVLGFRSILFAPLLAEGQGIGALWVSRLSAGAFSDPQIALLRTFADQAVIAINNARLFNETREALERQTATGEILASISSSITEAGPVFDAIIRNLMRLFGTTFASVQLIRDGRIELAAVKGEGGFEKVSQRYPLPLDERTLSGRAMLAGRVLQLAPISGNPDAPPETVTHAGVYGGGFECLISAPMIRDGKVIGAVTTARRAPIPFDEKQVALIKSFADQAVIAIANARLFTETKQALERQTATAEILRVISRSPTDIQPVLDAVVKSAARLCEAQNANLHRVEGGLMRKVSALGPVPSTLAVGETRPIDRGTISGLALLERRIVHIEDALALADDYPKISNAIRRGGIRTILALPLLRDGVPLGVITVYRTEVRLFSEAQIALLQTFADQAVIAIENVRLFNETKEALERQTATAEILKVIAASPSDVQPVFDAIIRSASRLAAGSSVNVSRLVGDRLHIAAYTPISDVADEALKRAYPVPLDEVGPIADAIRQKKPMFVSDFETDARVTRKAREVMRARGFRSTLYVPMVRGDVVHGVMHVSKVEPGPFPQQWTELLQTFADQAVIAIENVRLFNETKEALERQTATAEILAVISSTSTDTQPVFDAIVRSGLRVFAGTGVGIALVQDERIRIVSAGGSLGDMATRVEMPLSEESATGTAILRRAVVNIIDTEASDAPPLARENGRVLGFRSLAAAPLLREGTAIGAIGVSLEQPGGLSERHLELLKTFADQAVIAIENVRLFNETKEALERQTATAEVLSVISSSPADVAPVYRAILDNVLRLCEANIAALFLYDGEFLTTAAQRNATPQFTKHLEQLRVRPSQETPTRRAALERRIVHVEDVLSDPSFSLSEAHRQEAPKSILSVPLLREGALVGVITIWRREKRLFTDAQVALVQTFADQAVIAIENVRLFNETSEALDQQKASAEILRVISSSVADTGPVFDAILQSCRRLFEGLIVGITVVGDDGAVHLAAYHGPGREELERQSPFPLSAESGSGTAILESRVAQYPDVHAPDVPEYVRRGARFTGNRSVIFAPMLWEGRAIGAIFVGRGHAGAFSGKEVTLLTTFADQAVIAIQNARLFREINDKSRQLESANRHKSEFLANMSHELRTPLNAIIGFTRIVMRRSREQLEPKQYENLEKILASGQHLLQLINAILDLSKVEAGRVEVNAAEVALAPVLEQCVKTVEPLVKAPAVRLLKEFDGALPQVYLDEEKLRQIVINLLSNAAKFTERGTVRVRARGNGESFAVAVADTGIGIPADKLEHVFEEFAQADASSTRVHGGTGLGLTIARRLARLMGGDIAVESAPGVGSTFTLTLPVRYHA